ncbi:FkbM family methyltransferase [Belnapia moabensis]|uniref:FkbM family methyltransferase n=1 Tax=Belnapia moabensis TaxID=365533 RepID=UPI000A00AA65|nr:FkbM family methyltransferase [Belnapia moabensis]
MTILRNFALLLPKLRRLREARDALLLERDALLLDRHALLQERDTIGRESAAREAELALWRNRAASRFFHYNACFDPEEVIRRHAVPDLAPRPGYLTNFLGVIIDPKFFPTILGDRAGLVESMPIPANWHADIAEWGAALRAVDLARHRFTIVELGCGWGCWLNNAGVAARRAGLSVHLIGVEGDRGHLGFAEEAIATNGFRASEYTLHHGIASATPGTALFPSQDQAGLHWGLEPVFHATEAQWEAAKRSGEYEILPMLHLADVVAQHSRVDLLHVDIQGGEVDLVEGSLPLLREKVAYLLTGTHSRVIEGRLCTALHQSGWTLEIERPAILDPNNLTGPVVVDGVQAWRNPTLLS